MMNSKQGRRGSARKKKMLKRNGLEAKKRRAAEVAAVAAAAAAAAVMTRGNTKTGRLKINTLGKLHIKSPRSTSHGSTLCSEFAASIRNLKKDNTSNKRFVHIL